VTRLRHAWTTLREPIALFLATRLPLLFAMYAGMVLLPFAPKDGQWRARASNLFLDGWFRWDSGWYGHLVTDGYAATPNGDGQRDVAFWPLFPMLARLLGKALGVKQPDHVLVMFGLNFVLLAGATVFVYLLAKERLAVPGDEARTLGRARLATLLFLLYPYGMYYSAGYSEATYLFFLVGTLYFAAKQRWALAGLMAGFSTASRGVAVTTALALGLAYLESKKWRPKNVRADVLWLALSGLGASAYSFYLWRAFGEPFAFADSFSARGWGADVTRERLLGTVKVIFDADAWLTGKTRFQDIGCLSAFTGVLLLTLAGARRRKVHETAFAVATLTVYAKMWPTSGRYVGTIVPVYFTLAEALEQRPNAKLFVLSASAMLIAVFAVAFSHWAWLSG
jgi:hypothetical protein